VIGKIIKRVCKRIDSNTRRCDRAFARRAMSKCLTYRRKCVQLPENTHTFSEASVNKSELVDSIAEGAGLSKADAERALNALIDSVQAAVANDDKVTLPGFGSFSRSSRAARTGRNPRTGEPVQIAASKGVKFSAGAAFKSAVNK
jgi:DNA-binding protein HU-beta